DGAEGLVVIALLPESFPQVLFEIVQAFEVIGEGGQLFARGGAEEFLISAIDECADVVADQYAGASDGFDYTGVLFEVDGEPAAAGPHSSTRRRGCREAELADVFHPLIERRVPSTFSAEEHEFIIGSEQALAGVKTAVIRKACCEVCD